MYNLYLDDFRFPHHTFNTNDSEWVIVRSYKEFVKKIESDGLPSFISFDHDLAHEHYRPSMYAEDGHYSKYYKDGTFTEKTGYDCAQWLIEYCMDRNLDVPEFFVHSANPVGSANIRDLLNGYHKHFNENTKKSDPSQQP
jgi:hypothetical protein